MYYKVKLNDPITNHENSTPDGYLSNWIDKTLPALYPRGEAIKKAKMFNGNIELFDGLPSLYDNSMITISGNDLLFGIKQLLKTRELFKSNDVETINSFIYKGTIFSTILLELKKLEKENDDFKIQTEIKNQLNELSLLITSDFVLINDMCFS